MHKLKWYYREKTVKMKVKTPFFFMVKIPYLSIKDFLKVNL